MEGDGSVIAGVVKSKDDLIIIDEHRVQEGLDQPLLTVDIRVVHSCELMQEEYNVLFLQGQILFQFGCCQRHTEFLLLLFQLIHAVLGAFVEDACLNGPEQIVDGPIGFVQSLLQGFGVGGIRVLCEEILIGIFCDEFQKVFVSNHSEEMLQYKGFNPVLSDSPLGTELFLFGAADVVMMLHFLLAGAADAGHTGTTLAAKDLAEEDVIHLGLFVCASFLIKGQQILDLIEHIHIYDWRHRVFNADFAIVFVSADVFLVLQHRSQAVIRFYENPENMRAFERWRAEKGGTADESERS